MSRPSLSSSEPKYDAFDRDNQGKFMQAKSQLNISEAVKEGKVQTIIIPSNMTSLMLNK